jgi:hypothetical protein
MCHQVGRSWAFQGFERMRVTFLQIKRLVISVQARVTCFKPKTYLLTSMISAIIRSRAYPFTSEPSFPGILSVSASLLLSLSPSTIYLPLIHPAITPNGLLRCALGAIAIVTEFVARMRLTRQEPFARLFACRYRNVFSLGERALDDKVLLVRWTGDDEWDLTRWTGARL